jgi:hypothetical protein
MARAKVYNDNTHPEAPDFFTQEHRGKTWRIPKGGHIEADYIEAVEFKGKFFDPIIKDFVHHPAGFKMIRVEKLAEEDKDKPQEFVNHFTGEKFASKAEWEKSVKDCEGHLHDDAKEDVRKQGRRGNKT